MTDAGEKSSKVVGAASDRNSQCGHGPEIILASKQRSSPVKHFSEDTGCKFAASLQELGTICTNVKQMYNHDSKTKRKKEERAACKLFFIILIIF